MTEKMPISFWERREKHRSEEAKKRKAPTTSFALRQNIPAQSRETRLGGRLFILRIGGDYGASVGAVVVVTMGYWCMVVVITKDGVVVVGTTRLAVVGVDRTVRNSIGGYG